MDYEIKRTNMLTYMGYAVFAADLFGAGIRPTEVQDKRQHTEELINGNVRFHELFNKV